jgi:DNA-binding transcriptional regulator PaaX
MKYKYYFRKPRSEIAKDIFRGLGIAGAVYIAAGSPYFINNVLRQWKKLKKYPKKKVYDAFYTLEKQGMINIEIKGYQIYISLTERGKKKANWMQIDALKIKTPRKWDGKWRLVMFDILEKKKFHREALRGKLKQLGFYQLQKSIWVHPFNCKDEVELLRDFFGLSSKEMRLVVASDIEKDQEVREFFDLA